MMGLVVLAQVIRELIADGEYLVECIENRARGKVAVAFVLRSRAEPYSIQIETMDNKLGGLFHALLDEEPSRAARSTLMKIGSQPVPVVEVDSVPADTAKRRRQRGHGGSDADGSRSLEPVKPTTRRRRSVQQLALVPQESPNEPATGPRPPKRRQRVRASGVDGTP
jgi:hypothetical protein